MKRFAILGTLLLICSFGCAAVLMPGRVFAQGGPQLKLEHLDRLAARASEVVNVTVDEAMLKAASGFLAPPQQGGSRPNSPQDIVAGLKGVYVRSFSFDNVGEFTAADVEAVRSQLTPPWSRLVATQDRRQNESVDIYLWQESGQSGGLAIVVAEPKELTVVNIVGNIDLARLASLGGTLGIPLGLSPAAPPPPPSPAPLPTPPSPPPVPRR